MGIFCDLSLKKMIEYRAVDKEKKKTQLQHTFLHKSLPRDS